MLLRPKASLAAVTNEYNSASADDNDIFDWVRLYVLITCFPIMKHAPLVLFLVSLQPAQSLSAYAVRLLVGSCQAYSATTLGFPTKYLPMRLTRFQSFTFGLDILLLHSLEAN